MTTYAYRLVNVFTRGRTPLSGNPLCVFEPTPGPPLDTNVMQAIALQFNLSETTFILPSTRASAQVRIFTPAYEMPFAGHPTLGTAHVCRSLGLGGDRLTLEMPAGIIPVEADGNRWSFRANPPTWREVAAPRATLALMLGLEERELLERPLWVSVGTEQLIVPLASAAAVRNVRVRGELLEALGSGGSPPMVYVFAPAGAGWQARFFFPNGNAVLEDPATGSATANCGGWWLALARPLPCRLDISQGEQVGRASSLRLEVDVEQQIRVSGEVLELGRGTIEL